MKDLFRFPSAAIRQSLQIGVAAICLLAAATPSRAANYYVDYSAGSDSNAGTSTNAAWQHCPGDPNATSKASSAVLNPGDTVYFKGGVSYVLVGQGIKVVSGNAGSPIAYDGNSAGAWGTGMAVLTDNNSANSIAAFTNANAMSNVIFNSFKFTQIGGGTLPPDQGSVIPAKPGTGIVSAGMANILVSNCYFGQLGYYQQTAPSGNTALAGGAVGCNYGCTNLTMVNCELTQIRDPIFFSGGGINAGITISNCFFHDQMEWAITVLHGTTTYRSNLTICGCTFSNTDQYYIPVAQGGLWTGYQSPPHCDAIMMYGAESSGGVLGLDRAIGDTNVFIYNNMFVNTMNTGTGSTMIWFQDGTGGDIYNNVFNCATPADGAVMILGNFTNCPFHAGVYNNTFYGGNLHITLGGIVAYGNPWTVNENGRVVTVENNVLSGLGIGNQNDFVDEVQVNTNTFTHFTNNVCFNYNFYNSDQVYQGLMVFGLWTPTTGGGGYLNTNSSPGLFGWDSHSLTGAPLFVQASTNNVAANNLALQNGSQAFGAGVNLTALNLPGLNADCLGNLRPTNGNWTMGAYQLAGAATISVTPATQAYGPVAIGATSDLTFTVQNTGSNMLTGSASTTAPFSIVSAGSFKLPAGQSQSVTVRFTPTAVGSTNSFVMFPGGGIGAVTGSGYVGSGTNVPSGPAYVGGVYNPAADSTIVEWLKADAITGYSDGQNVTTWTHSAGQDGTALSSGPVYHTNQENGLPTLTFNTTAHTLRTAAFGVLSQPSTIWVVYKLNAVANNNYQFVFDGIDNVNRSVLYCNTSANFNAYAANDLMCGGADANWRIAEIQFNGSSSLVKFNGSVSASGPAGGNNLTGLTIGSSWENSYSGNCQIGEIIVQNSLPPNDSYIFTYFNNKWAVYTPPLTAPTNLHVVSSGP